MAGLDRRMYSILFITFCSLISYLNPDSRSKSDSFRFGNILSRRSF